MKFLFTLLSALLVLNNQNVMSQSFEFLPNDTITKDSTLPQYSSVLEVYGHVKNTTGNTLTLKWKRVTNSGTQSITQSFCDNSNCYSDNFISGIKTMDPIAAGDSGIMRLDLEAKCKKVTARVQILVWVDGDSANTAKTMTYISSVDATADCLTATAIQETGFSTWLQAYPNPATNQIAIKFASSDKVTASIIDINGRVVKEASIYSNDNIDIANLQAGIYLIRLGSDGVQKGTIRFNKQ